MAPKSAFWHTVRRCGAGVETVLTEMDGQAPRHRLFNLAQNRYTSSALNILLRNVDCMDTLSLLLYLNWPYTTTTTTTIPSRRMAHWPRRNDDQKSFIVKKGVISKNIYIFGKYDWYNVFFFWYGEVKIACYNKNYWYHKLVTQVTFLQYCPRALPLIW